MYDVVTPPEAELAPRLLVLYKDMTKEDCNYSYYVNLYF